MNCEADGTAQVKNHTKTENESRSVKSFTGVDETENESRSVKTFTGVDETENESRRVN